MAFDDLPLDRSGSSGPPPLYEPPEPEPRSPLRWAVVALAGVVAVGLLAFWWMSRSQPAPPATSTPSAEDTTAMTRPEPEPLVLPSLDESDTVIRDLVSGLSNHPTLARLLARPAVVRSMTVGVIQIADGRTPTEWLQPLRPATRVEITGDESGAITPESHARWNQVAAAVSSVSPADAAQLYVNLKPLIDQAAFDPVAGHPAGRRAPARILRVRRTVTAGAAAGAEAAAAARPREPASADDMDRRVPP